MTSQPGVSAETLALLRRLRHTYADKPAVYRDLVNLSVIALVLAGRADTTGLGLRPAHAAPLELTPSEAAALLGITADAVRKACRHGHLTGEKRPGSREWRITPAALADYSTTSAAKGPQCRSTMTP